MARPARRPTALGAAALLLAAPLAAQEVFEERASVLVVEVPVQVLVGGRPLAGLTAEDFEILDDGEPRPIVGFETLDPGPDPAAGGETAAGAAATPATGARRNFLFLFDLAWGGDGLMDTRRKQAESLRALRARLDGDLDPRDRLALAYYSPLRGLKLLVDFGAERSEFRRGLDVLELVIETRAKRLRAEHGDWEALAPPRSGRRARTPYSPIAASLDDLVAEARITVHRGDPLLPHATVIRHFSRGLRDLASRLELDGVRHLVLISRGLIYGENEARSLHFVQELLRELQLENWQVQAIDTGGLGFGRDSLLLLAHETGGELFTNSRDLDLLLGSMLERSRSGYLLAFQVDDPPHDGAFRRLEVRLTRGPAKARLVHRLGYFAPGRL